MTAADLDGDDLWGASMAEANEDGLRGGSAAPEGVGGPHEHDVVGDEVADDA